MSLLICKEELAASRSVTLKTCTAVAKSVGVCQIQGQFEKWSPGIQQQQGEMGRTVNWEYDSLPNVTLYMSGGLAPNEVDDDDTKRSHFDQEFNWRIDEDSDEFIIRIKRTPEFAAKNGHTNVALRIVGGLSENPDGSVKFDGGVGSGESANGVSTFGLSFKISHEASGSKELEGEGEPEEEPEEKEVAFFDHSQHKLHLAPENCRISTRL